MKSIFTVLGLFLSFAGASPGFANIATADGLKVTRYDLFLAQYEKLATSRHTHQTAVRLLEGRLSRIDHQNSLRCVSVVAALTQPLSVVSQSAIWIRGQIERGQAKQKRIFHLEKIRSIENILDQHIRRWLEANDEAYRNLTAAVLLLKELEDHFNQARTLVYSRDRGRLNRALDALLSRTRSTFENIQNHLALAGFESTTSWNSLNLELSQSIAVFRDGHFQNASLQFKTHIDGLVLHLREESKKILAAMDSQLSDFQKTLAALH